MAARLTNRLVSSTRGGDTEVAGELGSFGGVDFFMDIFRGLREFGLRQAVFLFGVIGGGDGDRTQRDYLRARNDPDLLALRGPGQPGAEILPYICDRQRFHRAINVILIS